MTTPLPTRARRASGLVATLVASAWFLAAPGSAHALATDVTAPAPATPSQTAPIAPIAPIAPTPPTTPTAPSTADSLDPGRDLTRPDRQYCYSPPCPPGMACAAYVICRPCPPIPPKICRPLPCFKAPCPTVCTWQRIWWPCLKQVNPPPVDGPLLEKAA